MFANGGSAGISEHVCVDLTKTCNIPAIPLQGPSCISCLANDYGYDQWVSKAIEFFVTTDDLCIFISSSGNSPNIVNGVRYAKQLNIQHISLSGFGSSNQVRSCSDLDINVDSSNYNVTESVHNVILLDIVERLNGLNGE